MDIVLWIVQAALAIKLAATAYSHGVHPSTKLQRGEAWLGAAARPLLTAVAVCLFVGSLALILPGAVGFAEWLTPWAAALLAALMLAAVVFHLRCAEEPKVAVDLVLFGLGAFVAVGRWLVVPL